MEDNKLVLNEEAHLLLCKIEACQEWNKCNNHPDVSNIITEIVYSFTKIHNNSDNTVPELPVGVRLERLSYNFNFPTKRSLVSL